MRARCAEVYWWGLARESGRPCIDALPEAERMTITGAPSGTALGVIVVSSVLVEVISCGVCPAFGTAAFCVFERSLDLGVPGMVA